ncbi:MAG: rod shape-determining protein RodA, partial [Thermotogae bacterium]
LAPVTGIPLPFVSYGGSSTLMFCVMLGLVMKANAIGKTGKEVKGG